ncbi:BF3164 family lipoprotein [Porphyromonas gulae]|nr:BF3164 family lipoprotein [Porphyromonas gulae]
MIFDISHVSSTQDNKEPIYFQTSITMKQKNPSAVFTLLLVFTAFLFIPACGRQSDKPKEILTVQDFGSPVVLVPVQKDSLVDKSSLYGLTDCGDYLLTRMSSDDTHAFKLIRKSDFQVVDSICPRGEGPEEFLHPTDCEYNYATGNVLILESDKSLLREVNIDESLRTGNTVVQGQISYRKCGKRIQRLFVANSGKRLGYILEGDYFSYWEIRPEEILNEENLRSTRIELAERYEPKVLYMTQSLPTFNPEKGVAFISYYNMRRFDLINIEKGLLNTFYFNEKRTPDESAEMMEKMYQSYAWEIASTKEYIYLGYALEERMDEEEELERTHILVFDWEGNPVKHLVLPIPAKSFAVSQDGKKLYTLNESETQPNSISVYDIK